MPSVSASRRAVGVTPAQGLGSVRALATGRQPPWSLALALLCLGACGFTPSLPQSVVLDGQVLKPPDAGMTQTMDADVDTGVDAGLEAGIEAGLDASSLAADGAQDATQPDAGAEDDSGAPDAGQGPEPIVEIGVPDALEGLGFEPLPTDAEVGVVEGGQAGRFIQLALRCKHLGDEAFVTLSAKALDVDAGASREPWIEPEPLSCGSDGYCTYIPALLGVGPLGGPEELDGMRVRIEALMTNRDGDSGRGEVRVVLRTP